MLNSKQLLSMIFNLSEIKEIPYSKDWENGTGYFDGAVFGEDAPVIPAGELVKSVSTGGRKIVMVGTRFGNIVLFERYTDEENNVVVTNQPQEIEKLFGCLVLNGNCSVSSQGIAHLTGLNFDEGSNYCYKNTNVGKLVENLFY